MKVKMIQLKVKVKKSESGWEAMRYHPDRSVTVKRIKMKVETSESD